MRVSKYLLYLLSSLAYNILLTRRPFLMSGLTLKELNTNHALNRSDSSLDWKGLEAILPQSL